MERTVQTQETAASGKSRACVSRRLGLKPLAVPIPEACWIGGFGRTTAYELIAAGRLKTVTVRRRRLVVYSSLEALLAPDAA
jgi:hypothetical protein